MTPRLLRIAIVWLLLLLTAWVLAPYIVEAWWAATLPRAVTPRGSLDAAEKTAIDVFRLASPSVVHVYARTATPAMVPHRPMVPRTTPTVVLLRPRSW